MSPSCDNCVSSLVDVLRRTLSEYTSVEVSIVECVDEKGLRVLLESRYMRVDRLLVPDAAALIEVGVRGKPSIKILVVVEHGGKSSMHDILQALEAYRELTSVFEVSQVRFYVIVYHLAGKMSRTSARIHSQKSRQKPIRVVLTPGCCNLTRHTVYGKLVKPMIEMLM